MTIEQAVERMGPGPLTEEGVARWLRPLFGRTLARGGVYLMGHSLGRPLDQVFDDLEEGARLWAERLRDGWELWQGEEANFRREIAGLLGMARPDCVIPKLSAGHGLRAVLNTLPAGATVGTTEGEFSSTAVVLAQYAALGRLRVVRAASDANGRWTEACVADVLRREPESALVVVSHVFYRDGQVFSGLLELGAECRARGALLLLDAYHSIGALPFCMDDLGCDALLGGCYKYLRGGEGLAFLALAPHVADGVRPLDVGWFGMEPESDPGAQGGPARRSGGVGWVESSPALLAYFQARSGLAFTRAVGVERLRAYSLGQLGFLRDLLASAGIASRGGDAEHGAFLTIPTPRAPELVRALGEQGITVDERGGGVRVCPDVLTTRAEVQLIAKAFEAGLGDGGPSL